MKGTLTLPFNEERRGNIKILLNRRDDSVGVPIDSFSDDRG